MKAFRKTTLLVLAVIFLSSCTSMMRSPYHVGYDQTNEGMVAGVVSVNSGYDSRGLIASFHEHLWLKEYHAAYKLFSDPLKSQLSYDAFLALLKELDSEFGEELDFTMRRNPWATSNRRQIVILMKEAHSFYDVVVSHYQSNRMKVNLDLVFGITREDNQELKICLFGYAPDEDRYTRRWSAIPQRENLEEKIGIIVPRNEI